MGFTQGGMCLVVFVYVVGGIWICGKWASGQVGKWHKPLAVGVSGLPARGDLLELQLFWPKAVSA